MRTRRRTISWVGWGLILLLVFVGIAASLARYVLPERLHIAVAKPFYGSVFAEEQLPRYHANPITTALHVLPGTLFLITGTLQFVKRVRARSPALHRWLGRVYLLSGLAIAASAVAILWRFPYEGFGEAAPVLLFLAAFVVSLLKAFRHALRREIPRHREWMIRGFALGLGISTIRVVFVIFMYSVGTGAAERQIFTTSLWVGWITTVFIAEWWIQATRPSRSTA